LPDLDSDRQVDGGIMHASPPNRPVGRLKSLLRLDWDAIAGVIAAVIALVLHLLHVIDVEVLQVIAVVLVALLFFRDLRRERATEQIEMDLTQISRTVARIDSHLQPVDAILIGPRRLSATSEQFSRHAQGEMVWFHVCLLMFKPQALFDILLRPAIENPQVTSIEFVLDRRQQDLWRDEVMPKVAQCRGQGKVKEPHWTTIEENVSVIFSESGPGGHTECLLSFWGDPFMSKLAGRDVPRFIFHVQSHSDLVPHLLELARRYRLTS
jgi:hypothetical protein